MTIPAPQELLNFSGKVVVVTGAGQGLGEGLALRFAQAGADVVAHYHQSESGAKKVARQVENMGRRAIAVQGNLTYREDAEKIGVTAIETFGRLDVWINNAGSYPLATVREMTDEQWDSVIDANLRTVFVGTQTAANLMIARGIAGSVVNIASIEAENPAPNHSHYNAAKAGVVMYSRAAAQELGRHNIRVNVVSPGLIWREGIESAWADGVQRWQRRAPLQRLGMPDDVADACLFLASPAARWITGANLLVDGGVMTTQIF